MSATAAPGRCLFCDATMLHRHHPTGRIGDPDRAPYADPAVTVPLCPAHHADEHAVWRALGLGANGDGLDEQAAALLCLLRLAVLAQRAAERWPEPFASFAAAVAAVVPRTVDVLEEKTHV